jgi:hypothetical protein
MDFGRHRIEQVGDEQCFERLAVRRFGVRRERDAGVGKATNRSRLARDVDLEQIVRARDAI